MPKLSEIAQGTTPASYYGLDAAGLSKRFNTSAVLNVADFPGVDRNGVADSYAGIQAAFDLAFGPASAPHGNGGKNRPVYFPQGGYKILTPLKLTAVWGGKIFGDGMLQSGINYAGPLTPLFENWVPVIWINGMNFCEFSNMSFSSIADGKRPGVPDASNPKTCLLQFAPDGIASSSAHGNMFCNLQFGTASYACVHGSGASAANSENLYLNCSVLGPSEVGLFISGANTLNFRWIGGGIDMCSVAGIQTNNNAGNLLVENTAFANNSRCGVDLLGGTGSRAVLSSLRTEDQTLVIANCAVTLLCCHTTFQSSIFKGSISGTTLTVESITTKPNWIWPGPGTVLFGPGISNNYNSAAPNFGLTTIVSGANAPGLGTYQLSQPASVPSGTTMSTSPMFVRAQGATSISMIDCGGDTAACLMGDGNSNLFVLDNQWFSSDNGGMAPQLISQWKGQIYNYDIAGFGPVNSTTFAHLPAPQNSLKGVRMFITDSTLAAVGNFGAPAAGGSNNTVPVFCDGAAWRIG